MKFEIVPEKAIPNVYHRKYDNMDEAIDAARMLAVECLVPVAVMQEIGRFTVDVRWYSSVEDTENERNQ